MENYQDDEIEKVNEELIKNSIIKIKFQNFKEFFQYRTDDEKNSNIFFFILITLVFGFFLIYLNSISHNIKLNPIFYILVLLSSFFLNYALDSDQFRKLKKIKFLALNDFILILMESEFLKNKLILKKIKLTSINKITYHRALSQVI